MTKSWHPALRLNLALLLASLACGAKGQAPIDTTCWTERPAISEGENVSLRALSTTADGQPLPGAVRYEWTVDAGQLNTQGDRVEWRLAAETVPPRDFKRVVNASVTATQGGVASKCSVQVIIGRAPLNGTVHDRSPLQSPSLLSGRNFLLPTQTQAVGFGLYSYLLFSSLPRDANERLRYIKTIEAMLSVLPDVDEFLSRQVRPRQMNITYIPVTAAPQKGITTEQWAVQVLNVYDYATAKALLLQANSSMQSGPYLVSSLAPLDVAAAPSKLRLFEDLGGVAPEVTWEWVRLFEYLAAGPRSWNEETLHRLGAQLRNVLAVGGLVGPKAAQSLQSWVVAK